MDGGELVLTDGGPSVSRYSVAPQRHPEKQKYTQTQKEKEKARVHLDTNSSRLPAQL